MPLLTWTEVVAGWPKTTTGATGAAGGGDVVWAQGSDEMLTHRTVARSERSWISALIDAGSTLTTARFPAETESTVRFRPCATVWMPWAVRSVENCTYRMGPGGVGAA